MTLLAKISTAIFFKRKNGILRNFQAARLMDGLESKNEGAMQQRVQLSPIISTYMGISKLKGSSTENCHMYSMIVY